MPCYQPPFLFSLFLYLVLSRVTLLTDKKFHPNLVYWDFFLRIYFMIYMSILSLYSDIPEDASDPIVKVAGN